MAEPASCATVVDKAYKFYELSQKKQLFASEYTQPTKEEIIAIATWIENDIAELSGAKTKRSIAKKESGLARKIVYDAKSGQPFIKGEWGRREGPTRLYGRYMIKYDLINPRAFPTLKEPN